MSTFPSESLPNAEDNYEKEKKANQLHCKKRTLTPRSVYLQVSLEMIAGRTCGFRDADDVRNIVSKALLECYGVAGSASIVVHVTDYVESDGSAILQVPAASVQKVWTALTLVMNANGQAARVVVSRVSPFLLALSRRDY